MYRLLFGILLALSISGAASAGSCPNHMKEIDAALGGASLGAAQMAEVKMLRATGEDLHKNGKHADSVSTLKKAKKILGIN